MSDLNIIVMAGRLVRDPVFKINGFKMCLFTMASNHRYRDRSNVAQEESAFADCRCFGNWTDALVRRKKGDAMIITGRLRTEAWEKEGVKHSKLVVVCDSVRFIGTDQPPQNRSERPGGNDGNQDTPPEGGKGEDEPPF